MKQLFQNYKTGETVIAEVPDPMMKKGGSLVKTFNSLISAGTEKMVLDIAKKSLLGKAISRPDLVKQLMVKAKQEGVSGALNKAFAKLEDPIPLGYSCAGNVLDVSDESKNFTVGERVACGGAGYACHSEINFIPKNLAVKIPEGVSFEDASFVTVGAIALNGVRQASLAIGEKAAVIGLGLIGLLTVQILKASGVHVIGADIDEFKIKKAKELGIDEAVQVDDLVSVGDPFTNGAGLDGVIITASTKSSDPLRVAGEISRKRGRVVLLGMTGLDVPRDYYYRKELDIRFSTAYGPGRYDPEYEEKGIDYPLPYVRWTEKRNFSAFLDLVAEGKVTPGKLVTHRFPFEEILAAYELIEGKEEEKHIGIVVEYSPEVGRKRRVEFAGKERPVSVDRVIAGVIGAGNFAKGVLLPEMKKISGISLKGLCVQSGATAFGSGNKFGFEYVTSDIDEILRDSEINTLFILTRHDSHGSHVIKALDAGKNVYVEKPLCISPAELEGIKDAYVGSSGIVMVGYNRRFSPLTALLKEEINRSGGPVMIHYRVNAGKVPDDSWIKDPEIGGGRLVGEMCHFIDFCLFVSGSLPVRVFAEGKSDENLSVTLRCENGSVATILYSSEGDRAMGKEYVEVLGGGRAGVLDDYKVAKIFRSGKKKTKRYISQEKGFTNEIESFVRAITGNREAPIPFQDLYMTTLTTFKALESLKSGAPAAFTIEE